MLNVSKEFNEAFNSDLRKIYMRVKIKDKTYINEDLNSFEYEGGSIVGESFLIGSTHSNSVKMTFCKVIEGLQELDEVRPEIGIQLKSGAIEYVPLGVFIINGRVDPDRNENKTTVEAMDKFIMMGGPYKAKVNFPAKLGEVALDIANQAGIEVNVQTFERLKKITINKEPVGYTYRQAIGLVAQFHAGYALFDRNGLLDIRNIFDKSADPEFVVTPDTYFLKGLVKNEVIYRLGGMTCKISDDYEAKALQVGSTSGAQVNIENKMMEQGMLNDIFYDMRNLNYYPYTLKWRGNPALEAGDWIKVTDTKGNQFKIPNLSYKLKFNGGLSADSSANTTTTSDATYSYKGPLQQEIEEIKDRVDAAGGNTVHNGIDEPKNPKENDIWFKPNGPDTEIWIYEKNEKTGEYEWVFKTTTAENEEIKNAIEEAQKELQEHKEQIDKTLKEVDTSKQLADNAKDIAEQAQKEAINSKNTAEQAIQDAEQALDKYSKISLGSRNLILNSLNHDLEIENADKNVSSKASVLTNYGLSKIRNQTVTISCFVELKNAEKTTLANRIGVELFIGFKDGSKKYINAWYTSISDFKGRIHANFQMPDIVVKEHNIAVYSQIKAEYVHVSQPQLEIASIPSDYKRAPEDIEIEIQKTADELSTKVSQTEFDLVDKIVQNQATQINQNKNAIETKADISVVNSINKTVEQHTTSIKENAKLIEIKADKSFVDDINQTVEQHSASIKLTNDKIQSTVTQVEGQNIKISNIKQTVNSWSSTIEEFENMEIGAKNYITNSNNFHTYIGFLGSTLNFTDNVSVPVWKAKDATRIQTTGGYNKTKIIKYLNIECDINWVSSIYVRNNGNTNVYYSNGLRLKSTGEVTRELIPPGKAKRVILICSSISSRYAESRFEVDLETDNIDVTVWHDQLEKGTVASDWKRNDDDDRERFSSIEQTVNKIQFTVQGKADKSQITLLKDQVNLKVSKGDLLSQINVQAGKILIQSNKLYLDAETVYFSGKAFIPSASILSLSADKINAGTLNAGKVNVINLNANNISSGTVKGANSFWNLDTGLFRMTGTNYNIIEMQNGSFKSIKDEGTISISGSTAIFSFDNGSVGKDIISINPAGIDFVYRQQATHSWEATREGIALVASSMNYGTDKNAGLELVGMRSYVDFHTSNYMSADYRSRIICDDQIWYRQPIANRWLSILSKGVAFSSCDNMHSSSMIGNRWIVNPGFGGESLIVCPAPVGALSVMTEGMTAYRPVLASDFTRMSKHSEKQNFFNVDSSEGLSVILNTDIVGYEYKNDVTKEKHVGPIINDDGRSPYAIDEKIINYAENGVSDGKMIGYLMLSIQELNKKINELEKENAS